MAAKKVHQYTSAHWLKQHTYSYSSLVMEHLSLWELCKGSLEGGLLYWGLKEM
jgi:hypothetical protein